MGMTQRCCFVLWGEQCDEVAAVLFITNLRAAGMRVWVVSISGKRNQGAHGLALVADMALDEALPLVSQTTAVIMPCRIEQWVHFLNDPRLVNFLTDCVIHQAQVLTAMSTMPLEAALQDKRAASVRKAVTFYPTGDALHTFAHTFAIAL